MNKIINAIFSSSFSFASILTGLFVLMNFILHIEPIVINHGLLGVINILFTYFLTIIVVFPIFYLFFNIALFIISKMINKYIYHQLTKYIISLFLLGISTLIPVQIIYMAKKWNLEISAIDYYLFYIFTWVSALTASNIYYKKIIIKDIFAEKGIEILNKELNKNKFF